MTNEIADQEAFRLIQEKMASSGCPSLAIAQFAHYFAQLRSGETGLISEDAIEPLTEVQDLESLEGTEQAGRDALRHTCVVKLNGGLGTSMGLDKAKALLKAREDLTFLDIIVRQILYLRQLHDCSIPLIFMNSFRTEKDTEQVIAGYEEFSQGQDGLPSSFLQNKVPKILSEKYTPAEWSANPELEWCPPGHGDVYTALAQSEILSSLLERGYRYLFISNSDNLGAVLDISLLGYFAENKLPFLMEVAERTGADRKGGHLARAENGRLILRESAQCSPEDEQYFQDISRYRYFNTNSLWLNLEALQSKLQESEGFLKLPLIRNKKHVDPTDKSSPEVFQLETAMGAAIGQFEGASLLRIPRSRFSPVKKTSDLLTLRSDAVMLNDDYQLALRPERQGTPPIIELDAAYFTDIADFTKRFAQGAPSLIRCDSLRVAGDVTFGKDVVIEGDVEIVNRSAEPRMVADGSVLTGRVEL